MGEGNAKDITLGEGVTTISLDDEKIGYAGDMQSFTIIKKARNVDRQWSAVAFRSRTFDYV